MIRFGANPIAWSNDDDHSLGGDIPLEQCLQEAGRIGFDGIEKGWKMPAEPEALRAALAPHGLAFVSGWWSLELLRRGPGEEIAAMRAHLDLLKAMDCSVAVLCETTGAVHGAAARPLSSRPVLAAQDWPRFTERLTETAKRIAGEGVIPVYHHHMGTVVQDRGDIDRLMDGVGEEVKLLLDTGHAYFAGVDPAGLAGDYMARAAHLHFKNVRPEIKARVAAEDLSFLAAVRLGVFTVPGDPEGAVDFPPVLRSAAAQGYQGWLVIEAEQDAAVRDPVTYQTMGLRALRAMAAEAGFALEAA